MDAMERKQDYVLRTVEERGVRLIRLWFTDVLGQLKSFAISPAELENAFPAGPPVPLDTASYFDLTTSDVAGDLRKTTIHTLEAMGIPVEYSHHEDAPSQHEIDLRYTDALTMADNVMTFRLVVKEIAHEHG